MNEVAKTENVPPIVRFKNYMDARTPDLMRALPSHISPERFQRTALTALQNKPDLLNCTPQSLWVACMRAAHDGLMPDGREGAIVPYGENANGQRAKEIATWMPMIEGLRKKARNSGEILNWETHVVRARDDFSVVLGDHPQIVHRPYVGDDEPGVIVAAYSIAWLKDGSISREVMTKRELDQIKAKSKAKGGPWSDPAFIPEMYRKTVARRHYKTLPHSSDLDDMIRADDEAFGLEDRSASQIEDRQQRRIANVSGALDEFASAGRGDVIEGKAEAVQQKAIEQEAAPATAPADEIEDADIPDDAEARAVPSTPDEYAKYARTVFAEMTDGGKLRTWWNSDSEKEIRKAAGVGAELATTLKNEGAARATALREAAAK